MSNRETTDIDIGELTLDRCEFEDGVIAFGGADVLARGTILARHSGNGKFQIFVKGGSSNGNGTPKAVLDHELIATGAGDLPVRAIVDGKVNKRRLIIDADGDDSNIDGAVLDQLRDYKITALEVEPVGGALFTDEDS